MIGFMIQTNIPEGESMVTQHRDVLGVEDQQIMEVGYVLVGRSIVTIAPMPVVQRVTSISMQYFQSLH